MLNSIKLSFATSFICLSIAVLFCITPLAVSAANCTPNASKQCISNIVYSYNSCGAIDSIYQNCSLTNQICQNAKCVNNSSTPNVTTTLPDQSDISHYVKSCYNNNLYWYSSKGLLQDVFLNCSDINSCTNDNCLENKCVNQVKCDGSTCAVNSPDYLKYCSSLNQNKVTDTVVTTGVDNLSTNVATNQVLGSGLALNFFANKSTSGLSLEKNISLKNNGVTGFLVVVKNTGNTSIDAVTVKTDITGNMAYNGDLKVDNVITAGNIATGVDLGTILPKASKTIYFTGTLRSQLSQGIFQVSSVATSNNTTYDSDYLIVNVGDVDVSGSVSTSTSSFASNLIKNWYIWLALIIVFVIVFVIIFRRLSSRV